MVTPLKRRATSQRTRKGASRMGFDALARNTLLRALRMRYGHSTRRASRLRASASETRLMRIVETGSDQADLPKSISCNPHSRFKPKKRVSLSFDTSLSDRVVCVSPIEM